MLPPTRPLPYMKQGGCVTQCGLAIYIKKKCILKAKKRRIMETQIIFSPCKKIYPIFKKNPLKTNQNH
jgi:hypothetical protein